MARFPAAPQAPDEFFERTLPKLYAARGGIAAFGTATASFGVLLEGKGVANGCARCAAESSACAPARGSKPCSR